MVLRGGGVALDECAEEWRVVFFDAVFLLTAFLADFLAGMMRRGLFYETELVAF